MTRSKLPISAHRNLGIIAHIDAGKTTLTERMLWKAGVLHRVGEVHDGTATMDHMDLERERGITIGSAATQASWQSAGHSEHRLTLIDTPGHIDFSIEVERSLRVLDGAIGVFCAVAGVQPQSETVWRQARKHGVPLVAFVNKMDRPGANFTRVMEQMHKVLGVEPVAIALPIGSEEAFSGTIDLLGKTVNRWDQEGKLTTTPWSIDDDVKWSDERRYLIETIAETDDEILEEYLSGIDVSDDKLRLALRKATMTGRLIPVLPGSAFKNKGVEPLLDAVVDYLPSPLDRPALVVKGEEGEYVVECDPQGPFAGLVFKVVEAEHGSLAFVRIYRGQLHTGQSVLNVSQDTNTRVGRLAVIMADENRDVESAQAGDIVAVIGWKNARTGDTLTDPSHPVLLERIQAADPVLAWRLSPEKGSDISRLATGLDKLVREDPSLRIGSDSQTGETVLWGMGELHLDVAVERLRREHGLSLRVGDPLVAFRETPARASAEIDTKLSKQTGGKGQFARVVMTMEPRDDGDVVFVDQIKGGVMSREFIQATEKGVRDKLSAGPQGYPVMGVTVTLLDGETHPVDSSAQAFMRVGVMAVAALLENVSTVLQEPIMRIEVDAPVGYVGSVVADLQRRLGQLQSVDESGDHATILAMVPLAQLSGYATSLRSLTQGRGSASMVLDGYANQINRSINLKMK